MKALVAMFVLMLSTSVQAAPATYPLGLSQGRLDGAGADILRARLPDAQFILFGEDHGFADSPMLLRALATEARPHGFHYLVVEVGPLTAQTVAAALATDGLQGVHRLVHAAPLAIPFLSLKDDAELASDFLGQDANGTPYLWGVDQEFIGSPVLHLERLVAIAPDATARAAANDLLARERTAAAKAAQPDFLLVRFSDADFDALAARFKASAEATRIIAQMKESAAIYQLWMHDRNYASNARRADLLARNFLSMYGAAADPEPKVVFKMGIDHLALGTTPVNVIDLGTLASEAARLHGKTALRIAFLPAGGRTLAFQPKAGNPTVVQPYKSEDATDFFHAIGIDAATLATGGWTLIPLEPVRAALENKGIDALKPTTRMILLGYDYVITTPDAKPAVSLY